MLEALRRRDFAGVLRASIERDSRGLERLADELTRRLGRRYRPSLLSSWQRGESRPEQDKSLKALAELERIFQYRPGTLRDLLPAKRPRGRHGGDTAAARMAPELGDPGTADLGDHGKGYRRLIEAVEQELGHNPLDRLRTVQIDEFHRIGADRLPRSHTTSQKLVVLEPGEDRYLFVSNTGGETRGAPAITGVSGCRAGRTWRQTPRWWATELLFDEWLEAGRTRILEYTTEFSYTGASEPHFRRALMRGVRHLVVRVTFDADAVPVRAYRSRWPTASSAPEDMEPLPLDSGHSLHFIDEQPVQGEIVGVRWEWV